MTYLLSLQSKNIVSQKLRNDIRGLKQRCVSDFWWEWAVTKLLVFIEFQHPLPPISSSGIFKDYVRLKSQKWSKSSSGLNWDIFARKLSPFPQTKIFPLRVSRGNIALFSVYFSSFVVENKNNFTKRNSTCRPSNFLSRSSRALES